MRASWLAVLFAVSSLALAACSNTASTPASPSVASPSREGSTAAASPSAEGPNRDGYPTTWRTGVGAVDLVLNAVFSGNPDQLAARFQYRSMGCVTERTTMPSPPICKPGQPAGTPVDGFPVVHIEGAYLSKDDTLTLRQEVTSGDWRLYAVYGQQPSPGDATHFPRGSYVIVLNSPKSGSGLALQVENGYILAVEFSPGPTVQLLANIPPTAFLLAPPK